MEQEKEITLSDNERQPCEVWTRVMGYHRPTTSFNIGKQGELAERKFFKETSLSEGTMRTTIKQNDGVTSLRPKPPSPIKKTEKI